MTFKIKKNDKQQAIFVEMTGNIVLEERLSMRDKALSLYDSTGYKNVFLDMNDCNLNFDMRDIVNYVHNCKGLGKMKKLRISGVMNSKDNVSNYIQLFLSSVGYSIHFFYSHEEAIKWLEST